MEVTFVGDVDTGNGSVLALDTDGVFLAHATHSTYPAVEVAYLRNLAAPPLQLSSEFQARPITALCFGVGLLGTSDPPSSVSSTGIGFASSSSFNSTRGSSSAAHRASWQLASDASARQDIRVGQQREQRALLFTASSDVVLAWDLMAAFGAAAEGQELPPPIAVMHEPGHVECITFCAELGLLAICGGSVVHICAVDTFRHLFRLEGHDAAVLAACFCGPHTPHRLVSAGEDRTFKVWDLHQGSLLFQSSILTAAPLTALAPDPSFPRIAVGAADGVVRFYDLSALPACKPLQAVDVAKQLSRMWTEQQVAEAACAAAGVSGPRVISSKPSWKAHTSASVDQLSAEEPNTLPPPPTECVLRLRYTLPSPNLPSSHSQPYFQGPTSALDDVDGPWRDHVTVPADSGALLPPSPLLLVLTPGALAVVDSHTFELQQAHFLGVPMPVPLGVSAAQQQSKGIGRYLSIPEAGICSSAAFGSDCSSASLADLYCCTAATHSPLVSVLHITPRSPIVGPVTPGIGRSDGSPWDPGDAGLGPPVSNGMLTVSVFQTQPLPEDSPLRVGGCSGPAPCGGSVSGSASSSARNAPPSRSNSSSALRQPSPARSTNSGRNSSSSGSSILHQPSPARGAAGVVGREGGSGTGSGSGSGGGRQLSSGSGGAGPGRTPSPGRSLQRSSSSGSAGGSNKKALVDQPVTFHKAIKSSGYGFVQPTIKMGRPPPPPVKVAAKGAPPTSSTVAKMLAEARSYPVTAEPPSIYQPQHCLPGGEAMHRGAIMRILYSGDGSRLLTCSADKTARASKLPLAKYKGEGTDFLGHNACVGAIDWSNDGRMVLTASADRSARLWNANHAQPLLDFTHLDQQPNRIPSGKSSSSSSSGGLPPATATMRTAANPALLHEVAAARFFYLDQFVMLAVGSKLHLYRFTLTAGPPGDDIERMRNHHRYKLAATYNAASQSISAVSVINSFLSPIALCAGTNRSLEIVDMATLQCVSTITDAHTRPVHTLVQPGHSQFVSHPREAYELFATAAADSSAKLWDVRSGRCCRTFAAHKNTQISAGIAFSPCLRYLATGSEDKLAYLYDLRQGTVLHRMRGAHTEAVADVAFHPLFPQLATACLDGRVHFFNSGNGGAD